MLFKVVGFLKCLFFYINNIHTFFKLIYRKKNITVSCLLLAFILKMVCLLHSLNILVCNPIPHIARLHNPDIVFSAKCNPCEFEFYHRPYQVHLYGEYKYLHFKYIRRRFSLEPEHVLPFAVQIKCHSDSSHKQLVFIVPCHREHVFLYFNWVRATKKKRLKNVGDEEKEMSLHGRSDVASCWSPGSHLVEQTPSLRWADMGFVEERLGGFLLFMWSGLPSEYELVKKQLHFHFTCLLSAASKSHGAKQLAECLCNNYKTLWGNKNLFTHEKTKQGWERHTHFFKTQPWPLSTSLLPDILYQAFYLFFIHFHNAFSWCDHYPERRLVNLQPFIIHFQLWMHIEHCCLGFICAMAPISQLYFVVMIS